MCDRREHHHHRSELRSALGCIESNDAAFTATFNFVDTVSGNPVTQAFTSLKSYDDGSFVALDGSTAYFVPLPNILYLTSTDTDTVDCLEDIRTFH